MRLVLLSMMSWLITLTDPCSPWEVLIYRFATLFYWWAGCSCCLKATTELHERLEGKPEHTSQSKVQAGFMAVVAQIVILDAVFSI